MFSIFIRFYIPYFYIYEVFVVTIKVENTFTMAN